MSAPKSVVKLTKEANGTTIEYTDCVDQSKYFIHELTRAAMRDVGKFIKKEWQRQYETMFRKHTRRGRKATSYQVMASKSTTAPRVQIGLSVKNAREAFYAYFQEFGSSTTPRRGLLQKTVRDNIPKIIEIESKYLSAMEGPAAALNAMTDEKDYTDED